jgi:CRISPR/Cas system CSM-associated protein Csm2 small subunit
MGDLKSGLEGAGFKGTPTETRCQDCGKPFQPRDPKHKLCHDCVRKRAPKGGESISLFEKGYPDYFDAEGLLKPEYVTTKAEEIAVNLGNERPTRMTMHQLRAFYKHVKLQQSALENGQGLNKVLLEISKLKPFANERANKDKVPRYFEEFINRNVDKVKDKHAFVDGFVEHFQAVVAYCAGTLEKKRERKPHRS